MLNHNKQSWHVCEKKDVMALYQQADGGGNDCNDHRENVTRLCHKPVNLEVGKYLYYSGLTGEESEAQRG